MYMRQKLILTPQEQSIKTRSENLLRYNLHRNCSVDVKQVGPHWGLYCSNPKCSKTGVWINWVNKRNLEAILEK